MKRILICLLILTLLCAIPLAAFGCKKKVDYEKYNPSKFTESIDPTDSTKYALVFCDEFEDDLNRDVWGDTRQGTRRDGYWTKNLAYTDGNGNLIIRTEKKGSRYCSATHERQTAGYNGSQITLVYDDCFPFGMIAGDFGEIENLTTHTEDLVGNEILSEFDTLATLYASFINACSIPSDGSAWNRTLEGESVTAYTPFFEKAMRLYNYYSFVKETKVVSTTLGESALIGVTHPYAMAFGRETDPQSTDYGKVISELFGFSTEEEFETQAKALVNGYADYSAKLAEGKEVNAAWENGCFHTSNGSFLFPIAFQSESTVLLTYVIISADGELSVWINDIAAALKATNYDASHYTSEKVRNEIYCKNVLFVTGPEGVYSGAVRTRDLYTHGFGYYEIRCKLPDTEGIWHAFWLMCGDVYSEENGSTDGIEIDVFEYLPARDAVNLALHWDGYDEAHQNAHKRYEKTHLADNEYHTFGMNWDENGYTFYIDRKKVWTSTGGGICHEEGYMKISTEYGEWGDWVGELDPAFTPVDWVIDYVKIYDRVSK